MRNLKLDKKIFNLFLFLFLFVERCIGMLASSRFEISFFFSGRRVRRLKNNFAIVQGQLSSHLIVDLIDLI